MFQVTAAEAFLVNQNWDGLETYLTEFLTEVQGNKFYLHPGLFCSLYQAQISHLIEENKFVEAQDVFRNKVRPLVDHRDDLYAPHDLEFRVDILRDCVNNRYVVFSYHYNACFYRMFCNLLYETETGVSLE